MNTRTIMTLGVVALGIQCFGADTYESTMNGLKWTYKISSSMATVSAVTTSEGDGPEGELVIPSIVTNGLGDTYPVSVIAANSFQGLPITSLKISDSVTTIGAGAFANCTALTNVNMGSGVTTIADGATSYINCGPNKNDPDSHYLDGAFGGCLNLESVQFSACMTKLGAHAFSECDALKSVELPDSLTKIGVNCFYHNKNLASVQFGTDLESIGTYSFYSCPELTTVSFKEYDTPILTIGEYVFCSCPKLVSISFSNSLLKLCEGVCKSCTALPELTLPDSLTYIGCAAFANCTALTNVNMGSGVTTIADGATSYTNCGPNKNDPDSHYLDGAFGGCLNLESVQFSACMTKLGAHAFSECDALKSVELPDSLTKIGVNCFYHNKNLASVQFGTDLESIGTYSFYNCPELTTVSFKEYDTPILTIGEYVFCSCPKLVSISFSNSLLKLCEGVCKSCTALPELTLPDSLTYIGCAAFANCTALKTVDMGSGVTTIADGATSYTNCGPNKNDPDKHYLDGAFGGCLNLESVQFSACMTKLGAHAFSECDALKNAALPESLQTIGVNCFYHNKALTSVTFGTRIEEIGTYSFYGCPALRYVSFAASSTPLLTINSGAFSENISLSTVELSGSLKTVQSGAFNNCPLVRKLTISSLVPSVGTGVFAGMSNLKEVTFAGLPPSDLTDSGLADYVRIRYNEEYAEDWTTVLSAGGYTNAVSYTGTSGSGSGSTIVSGTITVTNVIVHYVTNSKTSDSVVPDTTAGIVNIVAEIDSSKAVAIAPEWANQYTDFETKFGSDFSAALMKTTGKKDGAGNNMLVWQDYVAGTDPTKEDSVFTASITFDAETGKPVISWSPELTAEEADKRVYKKYGKVKLTDKDWTEITDATAENYNFFKISVGMK